MRIGERELINPAEDEEDRNVQQLNIVANDLCHSRSVNTIEYRCLLMLDPVKSTAALGESLISIEAVESTQFKLRNKLRDHNTLIFEWLSALRRKFKAPARNTPKMCPFIDFDHVYRSERRQGGSFR